MADSRGGDRARPAMRMPRPWLHRSAVPMGCPAWPRRGMTRMGRRLSVGESDVNGHEHMLTDMVCEYIHEWSCCDIGTLGPRERVRGRRRPTACQLLLRNL